MSTITMPLPVIREKGQHAAPRSFAWSRLWWIPLGLILAAQAYYTLRLIPFSPASADEARYIYAGHQLIHELLHGGGSPYYETYFSGSPVIYSPLAAIADHFGGIPAIRLMSLSFMLAVTMLLFAASRRLVGTFPALLAAGLFASLTPTQIVGRNAIYDAPAFLLTAFAAYCAVRARETEGRWLIAMPIVLDLAFFAKYITVIFIPVVLLIYATGSPAPKIITRRFLAAGFTTAVVIVITTALAGSAYLKGMMFTVFNRKTGASIVLNAIPSSTHVIIGKTFHLIGIVLALGAIGAVVALISRRNKTQAALFVGCVISGVLVAIEALHLHSTESMLRHEGLGAWFAAIPAGYGLSLPARFPSTSIRRVIAIALLMMLPLAWSRNVQPLHVARLSGIKDVILPQGADSGNGVSPTDSILLPYLRPAAGRFLISGDNGTDLIYNDHVGIPWWRFAEDSYLKYPIPGKGGDWHDQAQGKICTHLRPYCVYLEGPSAYQAAIRAHVFAVISITRAGLSADKIIEQTARHTPGYVLLTRAGGGPTWIYAPDYYRQPHRHYGHTAHTTASIVRSPNDWMGAGIIFTSSPFVIWLAGMIPYWIRRERKKPPLWVWLWVGSIFSISLTWVLLTLPVQILKTRLRSRSSS